MIVWIASYPRSGSSLLRQILSSSLGYDSYTEAGARVAPLGRYSRVIGEPLDEFRQRAAETDEVVFVKTHTSPPDGNPALYVVRDGRLALTSFARYEEAFSPDSRFRSLYALIVGLHHYGGWSEHYRAWHNRSAATPILTLEYGELFDASAESIEKIASFVGHTGEIQPWVNPIGPLRAEQSAIVGEGRRLWAGDPLWDPTCDAMFWRLHGDLMGELGFSPTRHLSPSSQVAGMVDSVLPLILEARDEILDLRKSGEEKERVIAELHQASLERLRVIEELTKTTEERRWHGSPSPTP